jgi:ABC-type multidrug transport system fused ATPase/permease subunit
MNLIERYIAEIGKHLPTRNRADIQKEIRSTLEDMLEDRSRKAGRTADEIMVVDLLKEFGKPDKVAATYLPEQTLISAKLYPMYLLVLRIVLPIVATVLLVTSAIGLATANLAPTEAFKGIGESLSEIFSALVSAFGGITLTFAILDRIPNIKDEFNEKNEEQGWNPRDLPEVRDVEKFSIPGLMVEIALTFVAIAIFNFYPNIVGFGFVLNDKWTFLPILSEAFFHYVPYLTGLWVLQIGLNLFLLSKGQWQPITRWLKIALELLGLVLAVVMLTGPDLIGSSAAVLTTAGVILTPDAYNILTWMPRIGIKIGLFVSVVVGGIDVLKSIYREISGARSS